MCNRKDITLPERIRRPVMRRHKLAHQILPAGLEFFGTYLLPLSHLLQRHARDQELARIEARYVFPKWVPPESKVPLRNLPDNAIVPLHVVDGLDRLLQIVARLDEAELAGESNLT